MTLGGRVRRAVRAFTLKDLDDQMDREISGTPALTGVEVSHDTAMTFSAFFSGVLQISQTVASLPLPVYRRTSETDKARDRSHPLYRLLNRQAGPYMTSFTWRETMTHHALVWGNGYSYRLKDRAGRPLGFVLMNPSVTHADVEAGRPVYRWRSRMGKEETFEFDEIFHLPGLGFDGRQGYSVLRIARESLGLGLALQEFGARFFGQGTNVGGVITRPKDAPKLQGEALERFKENIRKEWQGLIKSSGLMVLEEGMEYEKVGMPLDDAQFLASKQFGIQDVARWLNMPPHKLKDMSRATFNNIEQEQLSYTTDTIRPWNVRWETGINTWLIPERDQETYYVEHILDALLRGDIATRYAALATARQNGIINADEWRRMENWNPIGGRAGEAYLVNGNMIPVDLAGTQQSPGQALDSALAALTRPQIQPQAPAETEGAEQ